mgnify:FL=1
MIHQKCNSLAEVRQQIDQIDRALIELIAARQAYVDQAVVFKSSRAEAPAPQRIEQVIEQVRQHAVTYSADADLVEKLYRQMIQHFIERELQHLPD